ncbi:hypothetical protein [Segetibacter aerophilus]|uniref:Uncharacterized protein n=1 Tax=Segetibacter aerophilus TaxID=670293 RepID=A0A512B9S2_9BACT|nr:hypothetical protein [Segetibacter aerophilus]GEO08704.1 hypothetical protein SAE01_12000 [Segetibacter aerophilus]
MINKLSKPTAKVPVWNTRALELMKKEFGGSDKEWCEHIGILQTNLNGYKNGTRSFTIEQLLKVCKMHSTTMDYLCGLTNQKAKQGAQLGAVQLIEEGLRMIKEQAPKPSL